MKQVTQQNSITLFSLLFFFVSAKGFAQTSISIIDFYGFKTASKEAALMAMQIREGDTLTLTPDSLQKRLLRMEGIKAANVNRICCVEGGAILFVGVQEDSIKDFPWKSIGEKKMYLPTVLTKKYAAFLKALDVAVNKGDNGDEFSNGHSLFRNPAVKKIQMEFISLANKYFMQLSQVLQHSSVEAQREAAATIIAYASDKQKVADQYYNSMTDPSPKVRNNVFRALNALGVYATTHPEFSLKIRVDLFVWMLNSLYWSDRDKALFSLMAITQKRDSSFLRQLKAGALPSLIEMAAWKSGGHAVMAYVLLGRIVGLSEEEIFSSWSENRKEVVLKKFQHK